MTYLEEAAKRAALISKPIAEMSAVPDKIVSEAPKRTYRYAYVAVAVYLAAWAVLGFVGSAVSQ